MVRSLVGTSWFPLAARHGNKPMIPSEGPLLTALRSRGGRGAVLPRLLTLAMSMMTRELCHLSTARTATWTSPTPFPRGRSVPEVSRLLRHTRPGPSRRNVLTNPLVVEKGSEDRTPSLSVLDPAATSSTRNVSLLMRNLGHPSFASNVFLMQCWLLVSITKLCFFINE